MQGGFTALKCENGSECKSSRSRLVFESLNQLGENMCVTFIFKVVNENVMKGD